MEGLGQKRLDFRVMEWLGMGLVFLLLVGLLIVFVLLSLGFPPVIGNLMAARAMKEYAAQVHPEWRAQGHWAGYDLVGGGYYLSFSDGGEKRSLGYGGLVVEDKEREEALRKKLDIDSVIRRTGLWVPDQNITMWSARWSPRCRTRPSYPSMCSSMAVWMSPSPMRQSCGREWPTRPCWHMRSWLPIVPYTDSLSDTTTGERRGNRVECFGTGLQWTCPRERP